MYLVHRNIIPMYCNYSYVLYQYSYVCTLTIFLCTGNYSTVLFINKHLVSSKLQFSYAAFYNRKETPQCWQPCHVFSQKTCKDVAGLLWDHHKPVFRWEVVHKAAFWKLVPDHQLSPKTGLATFVMSHHYSSLVADLLA